MFKFSDYREFLSAWLSSAKRAKQSNVSRMAEALGIHTSYLAHILAGKKNLSLEQAVEASAHMGLTEVEQEYFFILLQFARAGSRKLEMYYLNRRQELLAARQNLRSRVGGRRELTTEDSAVFYSSWIYVAIFVATAIENGQTLNQISARFGLSRGEAEGYLGFLVETGICKREGDVYSMGAPSVFIGNQSPLIVKHHSNWRLRSMMKMDRRRPEELFFTSPMSISSRDFDKIREMLARLIEESLNICRDSPAEDVVCLNIDFFKPL